MSKELSNTLHAMALVIEVMGERDMELALLLTPIDLADLFVEVCIASSLTSTTHSDTEWMLTTARGFNQAPLVDQCVVLAFSRLAGRRPQPTP